MVKRILKIAAGLVVGAIAVLAVGLVWAHLAIRRERGPLPAPSAVTARPAGDLPVRLSYINTASQPMPRGAVLDPSRDPRPKAPYVMSFPSFVLQWADGRILLVDLGMTREGAIEFGRPIELLADALPIEPHASVAERLGEARQQVQGVVFTHLHSDHVGGIRALCDGLSHPLPVFMTEAQAERHNYTTRPGVRMLDEAPCVRRVNLEADGAAGRGPTADPRSPIPVPGFPGVGVIAAGGHTPGSQIVVAHLAARTFIFVGDVANNIDGIRYDIPKPFLYRWLMVPEDDTRLGVLRRYLRDLGRRDGVTLLVSHDQREIESNIGEY